MWDHRPDADELLGARLCDGWRPTPSKLVGGEAVLRHAACAVGGADAGEPRP